jgi:hypothetical protein
MDTLPAQKRASIGHHILAGANLCAMFSSFWLLWLASQDIGYNGERWSSLGALFLSVPACGAQCILFLLTVVATATSKGLSRAYKRFLLATILLAILVTSAAFAAGERIFHAPRHGYQMPHRDGSAEPPNVVRAQYQNQLRSVHTRQTVAAMKWRVGPEGSNAE